VEVPHGPVVDSLLDRGLVVYAINPKQLDRLRDRFSASGAKDDRRDAYVAADGLRTDQHLFRRLQIADPRLIQLREWSRLAEELQQERVRLSNRLYSQLWRYYPQMLGLSDDLAAGWLLDLWTMAPTPAKAMHLRKTSVAQVLKRNRIRRIDAETVLRALRQPAINVAGGVAEAATIHIGSLVTRLRAVGRELHDAVRKLDELCVCLDESPPTAAEHGGVGRHDVIIGRALQSNMIPGATAAT
jgi:Transposase